MLRCLGKKFLKVIKKKLPQNGIVTMPVYSKICIQKHSTNIFKNIRTVQVVQVDNRPVSFLSRLILNSLDGESEKAAS
jgi:hypothetical protein